MVTVSPYRVHSYSEHTRSPLIYVWGRSSRAAHSIHTLVDVTCSPPTCHGFRAALMPTFALDSCSNRHRRTEWLCQSGIFSCEMAKDILLRKTTVIKLCNTYSNKKNIRSNRTHSICHKQLLSFPPSHNTLHLLPLQPESIKGINE